MTTNHNYDSNNIFAKILRGEIPCNKVYEDEFALAFHDIHPRAIIHVLVIPKGAYISSQDFYATAKESEIIGFFRAVAKVAEMVGVKETGYRNITNSGKDARQDVPHMHLHILGGMDLKEMLPLSSA